jgi:hypothetical protein
LIENGTQQVVLVNISSLILIHAGADCKELLS